jgi:hypothetical protein
MSATKSLTAALVIAAAATAPAASARPASDPITVRPHSVQVVQAPAADNGFDWGDAGVGAGGTIAVALLSLGGVAGIRRAGRHGAGHSVSPAS